MSAAIRQCRCLCGGFLVASPLPGEDTAAAIRRTVVTHHLSALHQAWWARVRVAWQGEEAAA